MTRHPNLSSIVLCHTAPPCPPPPPAPRPAAPPLPLCRSPPCRGPINTNTNNANGRNVYESMLFLFVTHPYDVGDVVMIDSQVMRVKKISLLTTEVVR